jgi:predicted MPP superfamily phosphohydrolase
MPDPVVRWLLLAVAWLGHACIWTYPLNYLYGSPLPKWFLKAWRLFTGVVIVAGVPLLVWRWTAVLTDHDGRFDVSPEYLFLGGYSLSCLAVGGLVFPAITVYRLLRLRPAAVLAESTRTVDLWPELGDKLVGDGKWRWLPRLPLNGVFRVGFTDLTLAVPHLPPAWDGLTVLLLSDLHFHGTPSRLFFERVIEEVGRWPTPDVVALAGDFVDSDRHREWLGPLPGRLRATEGRFAILGNHDDHHDPDRIRDELSAAGYTVLSDRWAEATIRGVPCVVAGHEGPWLGRGPDLPPPDGRFRLCLSHTPDNFAWGQRHNINLMLCGHVHGGQVRVPVVGSIFVPSVYGRRYDMGVFQAGGTVMVVGRGLSGKEPLRFRCDPQVIRLTLRPAAGV